MVYGPLAETGVFEPGAAGLTADGVGELQHVVADEDRRAVGRPAGPQAAEPARRGSW